MTMNIRAPDDNGRREDLLAVSEVFRFPVRTCHWTMPWKHPCLYVLNWQQKKVVRRLRVPPVHFPAEEYRFLDRCYHYSGARGITANQKHVFVALQNSILVYGRGFEKLVRRIDHPLFNGIHEIDWWHDRLYVTCAATDAVVVLNEEGDELRRFPLGGNDFLLAAFHLQRRELDNRLDYRIMHRSKRLFHVNAVQARNGAVFIHLNRQGSFVQIHPREQIIIRDPDLKESHNARFSPDGEHILVNDTGHDALRVYDAGGKLRRCIDLREFTLPVDFSRNRTFGPSRHQIRAGWLRGLTFSVVNREIVYLGLSPALVLAVDYQSGSFAGYFRLRRDFRISVHGLYNLSAPT